MNKPKKKTLVLLMIGLLLFFCVVVSVIYFICFRKSNSINSDKVSSIDVEMTGAVLTCYYGTNNNFSVKEKDNIDYVIETLNNYNKNITSVDNGITSVDYKLTIHYIDNTSEEYKLKGFALPSENHMSEVLYSQEVVKQVRTAFTIDKSKVCKVQYYYWEEGNTDTATTEDITDSNTIDKIIAIAQDDALNNAEDSMIDKNSGFVFYYDEDTIILSVRISPDMEGYDELVKLFPSIPDHLEDKRPTTDNIG